MDDFDSFSTVVKSAPQKDDFDSFSSVVDSKKADAPIPTVTVTGQRLQPQAQSQPQAKPGMWDRIKSAVSEGATNLANEARSGHMVDDTMRGVLQGGVDLVNGAAQLTAHGLDAAANYVAPGSAVAKWAGNQRVLTDAQVKQGEDKYQKETAGSVLAGVGRVGSAVAMPLGAANNAERGATMAAKIGQSSYAGAKVAALQPVTDAANQTPAQYLASKTGQVAGGAALGAAGPVASKAALELASKLGSKTAEQVLTNTRAAQLFDKSPNASADAEVITELGGIKDRVGSRKLMTQDMNARQSRLVAQTKDAMNAAGATPEQLTDLKTWQGMTSQDKEAFRNTEMGAPVAAMMDKLDRIRALTPGELSSNLLGPVRGALDLMPIPAPVRFGLKNLLGGRVTRAESAMKVLDPRSQAAAQQYLAANGPSEATKGAQTLQDMANAAKAGTDAKALLQQRLDAQNKAMTSDPSLLVPSIADPLQRESQMDSLKNAILARDKEQSALTELKAKQNGGNPSFVVPSIGDSMERDNVNNQLKEAILARDASQSQNGKLIAKQNAKSPSLVVPSLIDPAESAASSQSLKDDIIARSKAQVEADNAATVRQADLVRNNMTKTPGGGAYQALLKNTGLPTDELNRHLRTLSNHPELTDEVNKIRVGGGNTTDGVIFPLTDMINHLADKERGQGALTQAMPVGALSDPTPSGLERVSANQQLGTIVRQKRYDEAETAANALMDPQAKAEAVDLAQKLKSTPERTERVQLIDALAAKYPQTKKIFSTVRKFK